jgi:hypothetical protein
MGVGQVKKDKKQDDGHLKDKKETWVMDTWKRTK